MLNAEVRDLRARTKRMLASKFVRSHLCIFMLKLSKDEKGKVRWEYWGRRRAAPA